MQKKEFREIKQKRILLYFQELQRYNISTEAALKFMVYIFNVSEQWLLNIQRNRCLDEFGGINLGYFDSDLKAIDAFVSGLTRQAKKARKKKQ